MQRLKINHILLFLFGCLGLILLWNQDGHAKLTGNSPMYLPIVQAVTRGSADTTVYLPVVQAFKRPPVLQVTPLATGFLSDTITDIASAGDGRLFVTEREGFIRIVQPDGTILPTRFLNISEHVSLQNWEQGLLGLVFHPNYPATPYFYISYTSNHQNRIIISRFTVSANPDIADEDSELLLLSIDKDRTISPVHNGGDLNFGPDGYLYISTGDGGPDPQFGSNNLHDPDNNGYRTDVLLGKIIRIDVNGGGATPPDLCGGHRNYTIPSGNPFADGSGPQCDEIWDKGLRNAWRFSFDRQTGDMFIGDVGEWEREEVNFAPAGTSGQDYGWRCFEGTYDQRIPHPDISAECAPNPMQDYTFPVFEYVKAEGCSVVGGFVYRGNLYPELRGHYLFGDFCNGSIRVLSPTGNGRWVLTEEFGVGFHISTFGEDANGEIFVGEWRAGGDTAVYRLVALPTP